MQIEDYMLSTILNILTPALSIGIGCLLLYGSWKLYFSTKNINSWENTQGTITKSDVERAGVAFIPDVEYQYFVLGVEYKSTSVTIPPDIIYDREVVKGLLDEYPVGKKVDVFYNPKIHRVAVLEKESSTSNLFILVMLIPTGLVFLIVGIIYFLR